eukprot:6200253-Pleurochrysis_carterae.AAC.3
MAHTRDSCQSPAIFSPKVRAAAFPSERNCDHLVDLDKIWLCSAADTLAASYVRMHLVMHVGVPLLDTLAARRRDISPRSGRLGLGRRDARNGGN